MNVFEEIMEVLKKEFGGEVPDGAAKETIALIQRLNSRYLSPEVKEIFAKLDKLGATDRLWVTTGVDNSLTVKVEGVQVWYTPWSGEWLFSMTGVTYSSLHGAQIRERLAKDVLVHSYNSVQRIADMVLGAVKLDFPSLPGSTQIH